MSRVQNDIFHHNLNARFNQLHPDHPEFVDSVLKAAHTTIDDACAYYEEEVKKREHIISELKSMYRRLVLAYESALSDVAKYSASLVSPITRDIVEYLTDKNSTRK